MPSRACSGLVAAGACALLASAGPALADEPVPEPVEWRLLHHESFDTQLDVDSTPWTLDPQGSASAWNVDAFDDDGEAWHSLSGPAFGEALSQFHVFRKQVAFGENAWLTAEVAAQDKDRDGAPDSQPGLRRVVLDNGENAARIREPSWDAGVLIRPTQALPPLYRVEVTLRGLSFGGMRNGSLRYAGKYNGYSPRPCRTSYPWTFRGALPGKGRCEYPKVANQNGFYYLAVLDHAASVHGNPGIHLRRKVIMDGYNSVAPWSKDNGVCNPATGAIKGMEDSNLNAVNAAFLRGDRFRPENNNVSNEYYFTTECGSFSGDQAWGPQQEYHDILSAVELQPELLPRASYTFAVERDTTGYTVEMSGPFRHIGRTTLRYHHDFVEDGRPIWHYNQTAQEYDGRFDRSLSHTGPTGSYLTEHAWPAGSAYPDFFIIGDPHLNYYEGSAVVDDIRLFVPAQ
ncbi:MAG: FIG01205464: hypothetical protein [uncultured Nocardioidaceae bacterium]|uniref:Uncharacterized protein n=1 Tax=uncultured Nocardioidaceae bacterium TaxID=253824 RepID=A0A6J4M6U9_9ACTN|nr:MAG: FIG01205464: hypothetical protein [uncultured Nocardioidaceae bacterium]